MALIYHIKAVFSKQSFTHMGVERQTNIHTYIHTNTHTFQKTISVNQAHAWFKNYYLDGQTLKFQLDNLNHIS